MDADLFMECEEEELEPWQQQHSTEDTVENEEINASTSEINIVSSTPATTIDVPAEPKTLVIPKLPPVVNTVNTVPLLTSTLAPQVVPAAVPAEIPKPVQGQQVILAPGAGGLSTMALSQVLLPGASSISSTGNNQPIYFTTQGLNLHPVQPNQNQVGLLLNVGQGQTVRPITLLQAPGTQIFKPATGSTQIITQPAQIRTSAPVTNMVQTPRSFSTVQIPATLTIRTTTPVTMSTANTLTTMPTTTTQTSASQPTTKIVTIKPGTGPIDLQNLMCLVKSVNLPGGAQAQTFVVMGNQKNNGTSVISAIPATPQTVIQSATPVPNTAQSSSSFPCPRCGAQFKMIEALRSHMCFCCPDAKMTGASGATPAVNSSGTQTVTKVAMDSLSPVSKVTTDDSPNKAKENEPKLVMLVDDFYYGTFEGNRVYKPSDSLKEPLSFRCLTCNKSLKNNIRLMTHMRFHLELDQQNGEGDTHSSCQHCFRHFPTPFRLQCHLESVHTSIESSTKCKICEWSFESEPLFLQHMKNIHKPGEMPYVCQVCEYRSSFYSDVYKHFITWHEDTRHLLCQYCLKVFKHSTSYQRHYVSHQKSTVYHCNKCRLQFLFTKDKVEHKINHHKTFRKPRELEGLQPGTKVTIRAYVGHKKTGQTSSKTKITDVKSQTGNSVDQQILKQRSPRRVCKMFDFLVKFQKERAQDKFKCLECNFEIPDFTNHYPTYVHCSLCLYSTCCSRAYANHMINKHVHGRMAKASKKGPPSGLKLRCAVCDYSTAQGNLMAKHLVKFPDHSSCIYSYKGNPRIGFVAPKRESVPDYNTEVVLRSSSDNIKVGSFGASEGQDVGMDQEMAPLEDTDVDTDSTESEVETRQTSNTDPAEVANATQSVKGRQEPISIHQHQTLLLALCSGIPKASKEKGIKPRLIKTWLRNQEIHLQLSGEVSRVGGETVDHLVEWVLAQREQQYPVSEARLFEKASEIQSQTNESNSFRISYEWAVSFMLQHKLGLDVSIAEHCELPQTMQENCQRFTKFVHGRIKTNSLQRRMIGAMDPLSIFVDFNILNDNTSKDMSVMMTGSGKPFVKIYLSMLADGTMLPAMLFTSHDESRLTGSPPDSVLLMAKEEGFNAAEEIDVWANRVWKQHLDSENEAVLVIDSHHSRSSEDFISTVSSTKTLPAVVPPGCTGKHQPLEMCVRPALQKFLLARWSQQSASNLQSEDLVNLFVKWLGEAMTCFSSKPEFIQHSFCLAGLIPDHSPEEHANLPRSPLELIRSLTDATLVPEVVEIPEEDEIINTSKANTVIEKIDLTEEPETVEDEVNEIVDDDVTVTKETEHETQEVTEDSLEIMSESTDVSHSSPESVHSLHNSEQDDLSQSCHADQTDSASNR